jgi:hypothetical protein
VPRIATVRARGRLRLVSSGELPRALPRRLLKVNLLPFLGTDERRSLPIGSKIGHPRRTDDPPESNSVP